MIELLKKFVMDLDVEGVIEPCVGGGAFSMAFYDKHPQGEKITYVLNDIDYNIYCMWEQCRNNFDEFYRRINGTLFSREACQEAIDIIFSRTENPSVIDRAWATWVRYHLSFRASGHSFGNNKCIKKKWEALNAYVRKKENVIKVSKALDRALIENRDLKLTVKEHATEKTLTFIDPPYPGGRQRAYKESQRHKLPPWTEETLIELFQFLQDIPGYIMITHYHLPKFEKIIKAAGWSQEVYPMHNAVRQEKGAIKYEAVTFNFDPKRSVKKDVAPESKKLF